MENTNEIKAGLIKGRHEMPVESYIFNEDIADVHNYGEIRKSIRKWIEDNVGVEIGIDTPIDAADSYELTNVRRGSKALYVYVTGLTPVTAELVGVCAKCGINLTLMNFNRDTGNYEEQKIFCF